MSKVSSINFVVLKNLVRTVLKNPNSRVSSGEMILFSDLVHTVLDARVKEVPFTCYERFCKAYNLFLQALSEEQIADLENDLRQAL
jgi:hypothetical protein